mgnify:CR=1 FL=1
MAAQIILYQIAPELDPEVGVPGRLRAVSQRGALLGKEGEEVVHDRFSPQAIHEGDHLLLGLAHADHQVCADVQRAEDGQGLIEGAPIGLPAMGAGDRLAAVAVEEFGRGEVYGDADLVGARLVHVAEILLLHDRWTDQDRDGQICFTAEALRHLDRGTGAFAVGDHRDAGALHEAGGAVDRCDDLIHGEDGPLDVDEAFLAVGAGASFSQAAIGAVGRAALGVVHQKIHAAVYRAAVHPPAHQIEGDRRGLAHLGNSRTFFFFHGITSMI